MYSIEQLVARAKQDGASDIHLIYGLPPKYRCDGELKNMTDEPLTAEECEAYAKEQARTPEAYAEFERVGELDAPLPYPCVQAAGSPVKRTENIIRYDT